MEMQWLSLMQSLQSLTFSRQGKKYFLISSVWSNRGKVIQMNQALMHKLLNAVPESSEWGRVYILDFLAENPLP